MSNLIKEKKYSPDRKDQMKVHYDDRLLTYP